MPVFWTGYLLIIGFASNVRWFPVAGMRDVRFEGNRFEEWLDIAHHLVLPALTLGLIYLAQYSRLSRASMLEVLQSDYVRTARAKGLAERKVYKHALRNAVIPVITIAGLQFGALLSGRSWSRRSSTGRGLAVSPPTRCSSAMPRCCSVY